MFVYVCVCLRRSRMYVHDCVCMRLLAYACGRERVLVYVCVKLCVVCDCVSLCIVVYI